MHLLVLAIFGKYCIRHFGNLTIFPRNIFTIFSKYFGAVCVDIVQCCMKLKNWV